MDWEILQCNYRFWVSPQSLTHLKDPFKTSVLGGFFIGILRGTFLSRRIAVSIPGSCGLNRLRDQTQNAAISPIRTTIKDGIGKKCAWIWSYTGRTCPNRIENMRFGLKGRFLVVFRPDSVRC